MGDISEPKQPITKNNSPQGFPADTTNTGACERFPLTTEAELVEAFNKKQGDITSRTSRTSRTKHPFLSYLLGLPSLFDDDEQRPIYYVWGLFYFINWQS